MSPQITVQMSVAEHHAAGAVIVSGKLLAGAVISGIAVRFGNRHPILQAADRVRAPPGWLRVHVLADIQCRYVHVSEPPKMGDSYYSGGHDPQIGGHSMLATSYNRQ